MEQTPAPSRRFLPPSSSSAQKPFSSSSSKKPVPAFSQLPPSSSAASPFSRASRFQTPGRSQKEGITTSFEDDGHRTSNSKLQIFTPFAVSGVDAIVEDDVDLPETFRTPHAQHDIDSDADDYRDLVYDRGQRSHDNIDTPLPKRRKISRGTKNSTEPILLSSSPPEPSAIESDADGLADEYSDLDEEESSPASKIRTPRTTSRFKTRTPATPLQDGMEHKPLFRPPDSISHVAAEITTVLPEAFTPSRNNGKKGYVPGGLADTIRNLVLGIATEAAQKGGLDENVVSIDCATLDGSGQGILATATNNVQWVLPGQHERGGSEALVEKLEKIRKHGHVQIFGNVTHWALPLNQAHDRPDVRFAAHWDV